MKRFSFLFLILLYVQVTFAYTERNLLQRQGDIAHLKNALVLNQEWVTYPNYTDRAGWDAFLGALKNEYIQRGEKSLDYQWQIVKATDYLAYERTGNRQIMEKPFDANNNAIADLLMAELAEGKGRFLDQLINGVFHSCEMTSWALSAHTVLQRSGRSLPSYDNHVFDLTAGDLGSLLAWTYYFMHDSFDKVDPEISRRLRHELQVRILDTYMQDNSFWWMGRNYKKGQMLNNWNPWCNSNALMCFMLLENNRETLAKAVYMTMESVDKFLNYIKADGACEEGTSYWGHASGKTLDYLELLSAATKGQICIWHEPMIKRMGEYISRSYIGNGWVVNFADASARGDGDSFLIYRFGKAVESDELEGFAALMHKSPSAPYNGRDVFRTLASIAIAKELDQKEPSHQIHPFTWYPETEFYYFSSKDSLFLAAKGGHNDESHNHNDAGSCSIWIDQMPILIDIGVGTYTRQTFSNERYSIWTMQSNYHNLPMINGISESNGREFKATEVKVKKNSFSANIATAYPEEAKVKTWIRSYEVKGKRALISDDFELKEVIAPNIVNFMTWGDIDNSERGKVIIQVSDVKALLLYDANKFDLMVEPKELTDSRLSKVWGKTIYRLSFKSKQQSDSGHYSFIIKKI